MMTIPLRSKRLVPIAGLISIIGGFLAATLATNLNLPGWFSLALAVCLISITLLVAVDEKFTILVLFGALAYPYRLLIPLGPLNSFSIVDIALVLSWGIIVLRRSFVHTATRTDTVLARKFHFEASDALIWLYVGANLISFAWAEDLNLAIRNLIVILENVAFYYLIIVYCSSRERTEQTAGWFLKLGTVALILSLLYYFGRLDFLEIKTAQQLNALQSVSVQTRLGSPAWGASNYFASSFLLFLPSYFILAMLSDKLHGRLNYRFVVALGLLAFFFTFSRGGYISLIAGMIVGLLLVIRQRRLSARFITTLVIVALLLGLGIWLAMTYFPDVDRAMAEIYDRVLVSDDINVQARVFYIQAALTSIEKNVLGLGTGNFSALQELGGSGVHNTYLQTALEIGWGGALVFVAMMGFMFRDNWRLLKRLKNTRYEPLAIGLAVSFVAVLINIAGEASFEGVIFGWLFWLTQGLVRALGRSYPDQSRLQSTTDQHRLQSGI